jgi:hypothetical protein
MMGGQLSIPLWSCMHGLGDQCGAAFRSRFHQILNPVYELMIECPIFLHTLAPVAQCCVGSRVNLLNPQNSSSMLRKVIHSGDFTRDCMTLIILSRQIWRWHDTVFIKTEINTVSWGMKSVQLIFNVLETGWNYHRERFGFMTVSLDYLVIRLILKCSG